MNDGAAEASDPHRVVAALLVRDGRVLLCHRTADRRWYPDVWDLPGGHVEGDEPPFEALARELEEEVGIRVERPGVELARIVQPEFDMRIWLIERWVGDPINASPVEHDDLGWFDASEASRLTLAHGDYVSLIGNALSR